MADFPGLPRDLGIGDTLSDAEFKRLVQLVVNNILVGAMNNVGRFTLDANQASTALADENIRASSVVLFFPVTANAAAEIGAGTMYYADSSRVHGTLTVVHANNSQTDRDFVYVSVG